MNEPAFLVDGNLEQRFIQNVCPNKKVRILNCNGEQVSISAIAKRIATQYRLLIKKCSPIIVVIDRESRDETPHQICSELYRYLSEENISDNLIIGVADRMIENWILADKKNISKFANIAEDSIPNIEGKHGKGFIKNIIPDYNETTTGVELLKKSNPHRMLNSESFKNFFDSIYDKIDCWWLKKQTE